MSYAQTKACILAATHCVCCGKPLLDAVSVELGVGPICRGKYLGGDVPDEQRQEANALVKLAASADTSNAQKLHLADQVAALGFPLFAEIVRKRFLKKVISIERCQETFNNDEQCAALLVSVPFQKGTPAFNTALKQTIVWKDRRAVWKKHPKKAKSVFVGWAVKCSPLLKRRILEALEASFKGEEAIGPKGPFVIGG